MIESINITGISPGSIVKKTTTGNITQILHLEKRNYKSYTKKLNKDEYINLKTGELLEYNHTENRSQSIAGIRFSIGNLRDLINNNFTGEKNELWITLTFGDEKVYKPTELCNIFEKFIKRLRYKLKVKLDYIYVPEPHEKGDWHIHLLLKTEEGKTIYIKNSELNRIWGHGFVKVNRLANIDNIGAYLSSYLINIKEGEKTKKGARLYLYPTGHNLYRFSRGIKKPISEYISYEKAKKEISSDQLTFTRTYRIITGNDFENIVHYEYYNSKR